MDVPQFCYKWDWMGLRHLFQLPLSIMSAGLGARAETPVSHGPQHVFVTWALPGLFPGPKTNPNALLLMLLKRQLYEYPFFPCVYLFCGQK